MGHRDLLVLVARNSLKYQHRSRVVGLVTPRPIMPHRGPLSCWFLTVWQVFVESLLR